MAKYKSLVSTLFIYNKICENVKKLENFEISTYLSEKNFSRVQNFSRGGRGLRTLRLRFLERGGQNTPCAPLMGAQTFQGGGGKPDFEFLGGGPAHPAHPRAHVCQCQYARFHLFLLIVYHFDQNTIKTYVSISLVFQQYKRC